MDEHVLFTQIKEVTKLSRKNLARVFGWDILEAQQLLRAGKSIDEIMEKTGLPRRVIKQVIAGSLPAKPFMRPIPQMPAVPSSEVSRLRGLLAEERRQDEAYAKKTKTVECPQCHRRRTVPVGVRALCTNPDHARIADAKIRRRGRKR